MVSIIPNSTILAAQREAGCGKTVESEQHHFRIVWKYTLVQIEQVKILYPQNIQFSHSMD